MPNTRIFTGKNIQEWHAWRIYRGLFPSKNKGAMDSSFFLRHLYKGGANILKINIFGFYLASLVFYATSFINAFLVTRFIRHERSECLIKWVSRQFINELHNINILFSTTKKLETNKREITNLICVQKFRPCLKKLRPNRKRPNGHQVVTNENSYLHTICQCKMWDFREGSVKK
jgi:hypothetical protein